MPSRCALLRMAATGRCSLMLMTPVGVFPFASCFSLLTSAGVHRSRALRLYAGFALRGPLRPIGEPGRFHAAFAMMILLQVLHQSANQHFGSGAVEAAPACEGNAPIHRCSAPSFRTSKITHR